MGDVAVQLQVGDAPTFPTIGHASYSGVVKKTIDLEASPPSSPELFETPCHGRRASRESCILAIKKGVTVVMAPESKGFVGANELAGAANDFPRKDLETAVSLPRFPPFTKADLSTPPGVLNTRGAKEIVVVTSGNNTDDADTPERHPRSQLQQQPQPQAGEYRGVEIRRVDSAAESVVDAWVPSPAPGDPNSQPHQQNPFDTVTDGQCTLRLSRPESKRASHRLSLARLTQMFANAAAAARGAGIGGGGDKGETREGGATVAGGETFDTVVPMYEEEVAAIAAAAGLESDMNRPMSLDTLGFTVDNSGAIKHSEQLQSGSPAETVTSSSSESGCETDVETPPVEGSAADGFTDNRISPFDADNSSLWAIAAAVAAAAAATTAADTDPGMNPFHSNVSSFQINNSSALSESRKTRSGSRDSAATGEATITAGLRRAAKAVGLIRPAVGSSQVFPSGGGSRRLARGSSSAMQPPAPDSSQDPQHALPSLAVDKLHVGEGGGGHVYGPALKDGGWAPAFGGGGFLDKTPVVSPLGSTTTASDETSSSASGDSPRSASLARARLEVEGDIEEGGTRPASADSGVGAAPVADVVVAGGSSRVAVADVSAAVLTAAATPPEEAVLPCAPSDEEKVMYQHTGRFALVSCALIAFAALSWGMWLFTLVTPAFYWFGVPAIFIIFYTGCHYLGVAIWGKDFQLKDHTEIVRKSDEKGYRPTIDVFLPVCKEPLYLLANTWRHVQALDYPDVKVFVLDDGASEDVKALAASFGFEYVLRDDAPALKKAGNLRNAFAMTSGEAIAIFDADFCPRPDFLKETVPYLGEDPSIGIVQTPQFFRHREEQTWIEQGAGSTQEFFYRMVQVNQDKFNAAVCVGSCGLYRRAALEPLGGMAAIEHSEDMYTGYKMTEHGFKIKYVPLPLAMGICPDEPQSFFMQQYRWCKGSATLVRDKEFWQSSISRLHKLCFLNGMLYYMATALLIFLGPIPILLLVWMRADGVLWYHSAFVLPSILFAGVIMPLWSTQPYGMSAHRVKIIQCYAHLYAIKDTFMNTHAPWVPSGAGSSRKRSGTYKSSVRLMIVWNVVITVLIVGGSAWRMTELTWYHFLPAMVLAVASFVLNMSTLVY